MSTHEMDKRFLTTGDVAKLCGVNFRTVIRWIDKGLLQAHQLPGRGDNRIDTVDLLNFLHDNRLPIPESLKPSTRRVLVVDDDLNATRAISRVFRSLGFEVDVALNGFQAGALLATNLPVVMTLDLQMPGMDGFEVLQCIQTIERLRTVKVMIVSAMPIPDLESMLRQGAHAYLEKPFQREALLEKLIQLKVLSPKELPIKQPLKAVLDRPYR